ncbi:MAG TPA: DUF3313 domain-containing protein [Pseudomonadales bacterium]|nr:DUF3313 domain-containing protein [Pseudomonadales bacterium]
MKPLISLLCATGITVALGGCATINKWMGKDSSTAGQTPVKTEVSAKKTVVSDSQFSGYLVHYKDMKEVSTASGGTALRWVSPDLKKGQYTAIIIDPVGFFPKPPLLAKVSKGRMLEAVQYLAQRAKEEIGHDLKIVDKPGPGVLRWDAAITGVKAGPDNASSSTHLPPAMIFTDASPTALPQQYGYVVFLESRLVDSQNKKLIAKSVRAGVGNKMADPNKKVLIEDIKPVLDSWVQDAGVFVRTNI